MTDEEIDKALNDFARKLADSQQEVPPEFNEWFDENKWDLYE
jgi:hypothetical protein